VWDAARKQLRIRVSLVQNYPTTLAVYTAGTSLISQRVHDARISALARGGNIVRITLLRPNNGDVELVLTFS
jgi:hypothetical protein